MATVLLNIFIVYIISCKVLPFVLYPNYLFKSKIETYPEVKDLALSLKGEEDLQTVKNAYDYMLRQYGGNDSVIKFGVLIKGLKDLFYIGDFPTGGILNQKQFLWCHGQNRILKSLLVNTGIFDEASVKIEKRFFSSFFIHQWVVVSLGDKKVKMDPYYKIFEVVQ